MNRSRLLLGVASVLAGTSVLLVVLGAVYNPILIVLAVPFAVATYLLWMDATGRLEDRVRRNWRRSTHDRRSSTAGRRRTRHDGGGHRRRAPESPSRSRAREVLGVGPEADQTEIRAAYRTLAKEVHPDADQGDEEAFKRVSAAYDRLRE